ncbi:pentatricopeptide repeat-containing protein MRL1, chloroplastic [Silene latifolia]|uniref:pentatricopeptide repeat-containing protein MRL1, chloroplastic n=1 Tax=Silene latifolia TaxID=37657 RepID=UPI003D76C009
MEAIYSPSTHTLALFPRLSSSSSSSSSFASQSSNCLSASKIHSIRTQFFGFETKLRLHSHRKLKRVRLNAITSVPVASLSFPIVAVAVAVSISAVSVAFVNFHRSKQQNTSNEAPGPPSSGHELDNRNIDEHSYPEAAKCTSEIGNGGIKLSYQDLSSTLEDTPVVEKLDVLNLQFDGILSDVQPSLQTSAQSEFLSVVVPEAFPELEEPLAEAYAFVDDSEAITFTLPQASCELSTLEPLKLFSEESNLLNWETDLNVTLPVNVIETNDAMSEVLEIPTTKDIDHEIPKHEHYERQTRINGNSGPSREDLYSFYDHTLVSGDTALLHKVSDSSTELSVRNSQFSSTTRNAATKILEKDNSQASGTGGQGPAEPLAGCTSHDRKGLWKKRGGLKSDPPFHDAQKILHDVPDMHTMHINGKHTLSSYMISYNRLLKKGRLHECIELLEDMDSKDILDMSKIYHAKFFNLCRGQKAVKEAFAFAKLIPNPTLSTFNMLMSVCSAAQDSEGAFDVMRLVQASGLKADCKLYTTLISTCAKSGKVDTMFEVFHEMVNSGEEPNVNTYGALIDGCAKAGQVAKAFGAYGILRSKNVKPDRVVFNALITACGQSGAVERAFDVLAEMSAELQPIDPDHVTIGALIRACMSAGQADRIKEVYKMIDQYDIKGTPELYTIAVSSCSQTGDWEFACNIYADMTKKGVIPDEMFFSALIHVAGRAGNLDAAFEVLQDARARGMNPGIVSYSSLMGACSNTQNWKRALELFEQIKAMNLNPTVSTVNALVTALCDDGQMQKALGILAEMKKMGLCPNDVTYSILIAASERIDDIEAGLELFYQAKADGVPFSQIMCKCIIKMCYRRFEKASTIGEPVLSFKSGRPQIDSKWSSLALMIYRDIIGAGLIPSEEMLSQILGCLQLPQDASLKKRLAENLEINSETSRNANLLSLIDGFAEYDLRAFSLFEEAASLGIVPCVSFKESPIIVDARDLHAHIAKVYILRVLKGLKHRLAAGAKLPSITILLSVETTKVSSSEGEKTINVSGRVSQTVGALLRRLRLPYQGNESLGKIRITGLSMKRWFQPQLVPSLGSKQSELGLFQLGLTKGISNQRRSIRTGSLSFD